jgi:enoyl-CoA hydratase/carnithine racemase
MTVVLLERPSPQVAVVRFNRPEVRNALNTEVRRLLDGYFAEGIKAFIDERGPHFHGE